MALAKGTRLGTFEVTGLLGKGGMGEVYRATDTKLGREVAIKVLPESFAGDAERLARFEREAKILASLTHPHISALYDLQQDGDTRFIVMELVEGETLEDRVAKNTLPVRDALPIFIQIAEALEAAHEQGVIHRDLKPANIIITQDDRAKILDFGLAASIGPASNASPTNATIPGSPPAAKVTTDGTILGTPSYMLPRASARESAGQAYGHLGVWMLFFRGADGFFSVSERFCRRYVQRYPRARTGLGFVTRRCARIRA